MGEAKKPQRTKDRGCLRIDEEECKGCGLCVEACPPKVIALSERMNRYGYRTALYAGAGCTGCGVCFMACPEPGAITVMRLITASSQVPKSEGPGAPGSTFEEASQCASN